MYSGNNLIVVTFGDDSKAYDAITNLNQLDAQGQLDVVAAAVVTRGADGQVSVKDEVGDVPVAGTAGGGLVGLLIGVLGGPLGVLIGGATGVMVGSLFDVADADETESVLAEVSKTIQVGRTTLLAQVNEQSPEVVDTAMARLSGTVVRRGIYEVEGEIAAAQEAQRQAKREARKQLREARHEQNREQVHAKVEELKAKLHLSEKETATSAS